MATHRAIPGANLPETSGTGRRGRSGGDAGTSASPTSGSTTNTLPGESGLGAGVGSESGAGAPDDMPGTMGATGSRAYPRAVGVMDQVKQTASSRVNEQKARAADGLGSVAHAIRQASEQMRAENQTLAAYADTAVDQIQLFADRMRDKDAAEMVRDLEGFARRNPRAFVGGAFVLGLGLARFLKSSSAQTFDGPSRRHDDSGFGQGPSVTTPLPGQTGFTAPGSDFTRPAEAGRGPGGLAIDPAPGITS